MGLDFIEFAVHRPTLEHDWKQFTAFQRDSPRRDGTMRGWKLFL